MTFLFIWGGLWLALFALRAVAVAATPTTERAKLKLSSVLWISGISFVAALIVNGIINIF